MREQFSSSPNDQSETAKQNAEALAFKNESQILQIVIPGILTFATNTYHYLHWKLCTSEDCIIKFLIYIYFQLQVVQSNFTPKL